MFCEQALMKQIVASIEPKKYLKALHNTVTNTITQEILDALTNLFHRYGKVNLDLCYARKKLK